MSASVIHGDARTLPLADASMHAIVCDPPYGLGFMGKHWDRGAVAFDPTAWAEALRVLKPGGHLAAFGGTRTFHRLAVAIEDAGFEIRDTIGVLGWAYGSGFPKSLDVSKAIDKAASAERPVVAPYPAPRVIKTVTAALHGGWQAAPVISAPATTAAAAWSGWGTALKPAWEPVILARKPFGGTVAHNVITHGVGGLNIDGCRVPAAADYYDDPGNAETAAWDTDIYHKRTLPYRAAPNGAGRWPPNLVIVHHPDCAERCADGCHVPEMDRQSGQSASQPSVPGKHRNTRVYGGGRGLQTPPGVRGHNDQGGASRFFPIFRYQPKAGRAERPTIERDGRTVLHPTVKPLGLMRWLCRLLTPPGGTVLDMFAGSGATLQAARLEGFDAIGVELDSDYVHLIRERLSWPLPAVQESLLD